MSEKLADSEGINYWTETAAMHTVNLDGRAKQMHKSINCYRASVNLYCVNISKKNLLCRIMCYK